MPKNKMGVRHTERRKLLNYNLWRYLWLCLFFYFVLSSLFLIPYISDLYIRGESVSASVFKLLLSGFVIILILMLKEIFSFGFDNCVMKNIKNGSFAFEDAFIGFNIRRFLGIIKLKLFLLLIKSVTLIISVLPSFLVFAFTLIAAENGFSENSVYCLLLADVFLLALGVVFFLRQSALFFLTRYIMLSEGQKTVKECIDESAVIMKKRRKPIFALRRKMLFPLLSCVTVVTIPFAFVYLKEEKALLAYDIIKNKASR